VKSKLTGAKTSLNRDRHVRITHRILAILVFLKKTTPYQYSAPPGEKCGLVVLRWRPALRQTGGLWPVSAQVCQYLLNHQWVFDALGNDLHAAAADTTRFDVDIEHPLQALRSAHRRMA
jgi:hypothetical protein